MTSPQETGVVLLSGGLDSVLSATLAAQELRLKLALTFDYGQRAAPREIAAARWFCEQWDLPHQVIELPWLAKLTTTALVNRNLPLPQLAESTLDDPKITQTSAQAVWVPNRNGVLLNIAAAHAESSGCPWLITGFNVEEGGTFPDNTASAVATANEFFRWMTLSQVRVKSWVQDMTKSTMVQTGIALQLPFERLWSCYEGLDKMCGRCESCLRSIRAYRQHHIWERMKHHFLQ